MGDPMARQATLLAGFAQWLASHGFTAQPLNLLVVHGEKTVTILCRPRADDGGRLWFVVPALNRWLAEADNPTWALTALKSLLGETAQ